MARASTLRGWRGREQLRELQLRRLQRDVRDIKRRLWTLEVRAMIDDCDAPPLEQLPEAVVVPQRVLKEAKPRIKSGATEEQDSPPALPLPAVAVMQPAAVESGAPCAPSPAVVAPGETAPPAPGLRQAQPERDLGEPDTFGEVKRKPRPDWQRMAEALKRKDAALPADAPAAAPVRTKALPVAYDKGPCPRCGIPGFRGCDHQLPYDEAKL